MRHRHGSGYGPGRLGRRLGGDEGIREKRVVDGGHGLPHSPALDVAFTPTVSSWQGKTRVELELKDLVVT